MSLDDRSAFLKVGVKSALLRLLGNLPSDIHRFISEHKTSAERSSLAFNILGGILSFSYALEESRFSIDLTTLLSDISRKKSYHMDILIGLF